MARLNAKVMTLCSLSDKPSKQGMAKDLEDTQDKLFRLSPKRWFRDEPTSKGKVMAEVNDIGFGTVDSGN